MVRLLYSIRSLCSLCSLGSLSLLCSLTHLPLPSCMQPLDRLDRLGRRRPPSALPGRCLHGKAADPFDALDKAFAQRKKADQELLVASHNIQGQADDPFTPIAHDSQPQKTASRKQHLAADPFVALAHSAKEQKHANREQLLAAELGSGPLGPAVRLPANDHHFIPPSSWLHGKPPDYDFQWLDYPDNPRQQRALPTGFDDMSEWEQQAQLWIVHAEYKLGTEWELADPGKHVAYYRKGTPFSPTAVIGILDRWRGRYWNPQQWRLARAIASNRYLRLPVLAAQASLRRQCLLARRRGEEYKMERYLGSTLDWKMRMQELQDTTGFTEADVKQWVWILQADAADNKLHRFLDSKCRKPLWLLNVIIAKDKNFRDRPAFARLLQYIRTSYVCVAMSPNDPADAAPASPPPRNLSDRHRGLPMTWAGFLRVLNRLARYCRERWPEALPMLADLAADYIQSYPPHSDGSVLTGLQARSAIFNESLRHFAKPTIARPLENREHGWAAQRRLLCLAAELDPPVVVDQGGYRAIREVLSGLEKNKQEARNAERTATSWPPYRRAVDGIDERRDPEDDLSRNVKAGMLANSAGYHHDTPDKILDAIGGSRPGELPTTQTRTVPRPAAPAPYGNHNFILLWAQQVQATRNAREAWIRFGAPPVDGMVRDVRVYAAMFEKLYAPVTQLPVPFLPGDNRVAFPVDDSNLSEFEIARLAPPTPQELYERMVMHDGIRPAGLCLTLLIRNARNKEDALRYLKDSPHAMWIGALAGPIMNASARGLATTSKLPYGVFHAWIHMLCARRKERIGGEGHNVTPFADAWEPGRRSLWTPRMGRMWQDFSIHEAVALTNAFQEHNPRLGGRAWVPWLAILRALSEGKSLYSVHGREFNMLKNVIAFLDTFDRTTTKLGLDIRAFELLCGMILRALRRVGFKKVDGVLVPRENIVSLKLVQVQVVRAHARAVTAFRGLADIGVTALPDGDESGSEPGTGSHEGEDGEAGVGSHHEDGEDEAGVGSHHEGGNDEAETSSRRDGHDETEASSHPDGGHEPSEAQDEPKDEADAWASGDELDEADGFQWQLANFAQFGVVGMPLYQYMRTLAVCGNEREMVRVMDWLLDGWTEGYLGPGVRSGHTRAFQFLARTIAYFAMVGRVVVAPGEIKRLQGRLDDLQRYEGCPWFWPDPDEMAQTRDVVEDLASISHFPHLRGIVRAEILDRDKEALRSARVLEERKERAAEVAAAAAP